MCLALVLVGLLGCEKTASGPDNIETFQISGQPFQLELAMTNETRKRGLGGRTEIAADGGMLFIFQEARVQRFCMRDCLTEMDIVYLDPLGYITAIHTMPVEPPRQEGESDAEYENRLPGYPSGYPAKFVIELAPGTAKKIGLKKGKRVPDLDVDRLIELSKIAEKRPSLVR